MNKLTNDNMNIGQPKITAADLVCLQCNFGLDMIWKYCPDCGWEIGTKPLWAIFKPMEIIKSNIEIIESNNKE